MPRVKRGVVARAKHKKVLEQAKGFRGRRKNVYRVAKQAVMKAGQYAYRDRRAKKREFRALWIIRINAAARACGLTYSTLINGLKKASIDQQEILLQELDYSESDAFRTHWPFLRDRRLDSYAPLTKRFIDDETQA